ncbi:MAG: tetratricopeptide repeat protein [Rhodospirillales bacterium]
MSLILDALRKSERERLGREPATDRRPASMDELDREETAPEAGRRWPIVAGLCVALIIVGGAAGYRLWPEPAREAAADATPTPATPPNVESAAPDAPPDGTGTDADIAMSADTTRVPSVPAEQVVVMSAAEPSDDLLTREPETAPTTGSEPVSDPAVEPLPATSSAAQPEPGPAPDVTDVETATAEQTTTEEVPAATLEPADGPQQPVEPLSTAPVETAPVETALTETADFVQADDAPPVPVEETVSEPAAQSPSAMAADSSPVEIAETLPDPIPMPEAKPAPPVRPVAESGDSGAGTAVDLYERALAFEDEGLHEQAIEAYTEAILQKPDFVEAYYGRAWAHIANGSYADAISNFTRLLAIRPAMPEAYFGRGWAHERQDQIREAIRDYSEAIRIAPKMAALRFNRGILKLYQDDFTGAERDFIAIQDYGSPEERDLATVWTIVTRGKSGTPVADILPALRDVPAQTTWPGTIVDFFFDRTTVDEVVALTETGHYREEAKRACTAFYFLGQHALLSGKDGDAANYFRRAVDTNATTLRQYWAAILELDRLGIVY